MKNLILNNYNKHRETIHNFFWRSLQVFGKYGISFLILIISAKILTPYEFGVYNYILAFIFLLIIFSDFGISQATAKYVAEYYTTDREKLKEVLFNSLIIILVLSLAVVLFLSLFGKFFLGEYFQYIIYTLPIVLLSPLSSLYDGVYRGLKQFKKVSLITTIVGLISIFIVFILVLNYGLIGALVSQTLFYLLLSVFLALGYKDFKVKYNYNLMKTIVSYSLLIGIANMGYFLYTKVDLIILGQFGYIEEIGYYEIINKIFMILLIPFSIFSQIMAPNITKFFYTKEISKLKYKYKKYLLYSFFISIIISILFYFLFPFFLKLFLPNYFNETIILMMSLLLLIFFSQSMSLIASVMFSTACGNAKYNMYFLLFFGFMNLPLSIILIYKFGFIGVIYSTIFLKIIADILFIFYYYKKIK